MLDHLFALIGVLFGVPITLGLVLVIITLGHSLTKRLLDRDQ